MKELRKKYDVIEYIGIAADETQRVRDKYYPLIDWGMTEEDCLRYCYEIGFTWDGLYEVFNRLSCWCCPLQSIDELRKLYTYYPQLWQKLEEWDEHTWRQFRADYSVKELLLRFEFEKEWQSRGLIVKNKWFYQDLRSYIDAA